MSKMEMRKRGEGFELTGTLKFKDYGELQAFCMRILQYPKLVVRLNTLLMVQEPNSLGSPMIIDDEY